MTEYLLIESRDPSEATDVGYFYDLASGLKAAGNTVTLFLVQNGVFPARQSSISQSLARAAGTGVEVLADDFSLRERGITPERLTAGVKPAPIEVVVDRLAAGCKALWH
jgi:predicted peroxiredoxin